MMKLERVGACNALKRNNNDIISNDKAMRSAKRKMIYMNIIYLNCMEKRAPVMAFYSYFFWGAHKYMKRSLACTDIFINIWWMLLNVFS